MTAVPPVVLVVGPTPPPFHGVAVATHSLLTASAGQPIALLHLDIADRRGIEHVDKPDLYDAYLFCRQWLRLAWLLILHRPRVVYLSISQAAIGFVRDSLFIALARLFGARIVIHLHGSDFARWYDELGTSLRKFVRFTLRGCTRFIVLAQSIGDSISHIIAAEKIVVVPNGIRWKSVPERDTRRHGAERLLFLSTLSRAKGALLLLEALLQVRTRRPRVEVVFAGPWLHEADRAAAQQFVASNELYTGVSFVGEVEGPEKVELFESADVFVFPGIQQEGQPLVVLEAMAAGLPVIFSDRGCLVETVGTGECGLQFKLGDAADLAAKITWLLERPQEMHRLGANGRRKYERCYSEWQFISKMTQVFIDSAGIPG